MELDGVLNELYALPLDEFVAARDALAKRLKQDGERDAARAIRAARKPNVPAWALNQLVRRHRAEVEELLDIRDRMASGGARELRAATAERRAAMARLLELAGDILDEGGHGRGANLDKVARSLYAGERERDVLLSGRLERELEPDALEGAFGALPAIEEPEVGGEDRRRLETARARADEATRAAEDAAREAHRLARVAQDARAEAERAEAAALKAQRRADRAADAAAAARATAEEGAGSSDPGGR